MHLPFTNVHIVMGLSTVDSFTRPPGNKLSPFTHIARHPSAKAGGYALGKNTHFLLVRPSEDAQESQARDNLGHLPHICVGLSII